MPEVMPAGLRLLRVTDSENRPALSWLGQTQGLKNLRMSRMPIESLSRVQDFSDLEQLSIEHMGLTQLDDQLQFPPSVKTVSVSGNKLTSLPAGDAWKRLQELSAYDNPLVDTSCPAAKCNFDRHMSPKNLREYCENVTQWTGFEYGYSNLLWSIIQKGPQEEGGFWTLNCDRIEETARTVKEMYLSNPLLDDIRPLAHLPALESLDLSRSAVRDFSPLASLEMLRAVYLNEIPSFDLTVFKNNIGTRIMGMESQDVSQESCPILAGVCSFVQDEKWTTKYGPILGAQKETTIYQRSEVTLPGVKKSFKTF